MVLVRHPSRQRLHDRIWGLGCTELAMIADALEVIAYRAESTVEAGEAGGAAHPVVFHDFQVRRAFDPYGAGNGSIQELKARQLPFTRRA